MEKNLILVDIHLSRTHSQAIIRKELVCGYSLRELKNLTKLTTLRKLRIIEVSVIKVCLYTVASELHHFLREKVINRFLACRLSRYNILCQQSFVDAIDLNVPKRVMQSLKC